MREIRKEINKKNISTNLVIVIAGFLMTISQGSILVSDACAESKSALQGTGNILVNDTENLDEATRKLKEAERRLLEKAFSEQSNRVVRVEGETISSVPKEPKPISVAKEPSVDQVTTKENNLKVTKGDDSEKSPSGDREDLRGEYEVQAKKMLVAESSATKALDDLKAVIEKYNQALAELSKKESEINELTLANSELKVRLEKFDREINLVDSQKQQIDEKSKALMECNNLSHKLGSEKAALKSKLSNMSQDLGQTKNRLMLAETEVQRLSKIMTTANQFNLARLKGDSTTSVASTQKAATPLKVVSKNLMSPQRTVQRTKTVAKAEPARPDMQTDLPIAVVSVDKANLRSGPGDNNAPLMAVSSGSRLVIETRRGDWYRVITPNGTRAWISSKVVKVNGLRADNSSQAQVKGFDPRSEDEAFKLISGRAVN